MEAYHQRLQKEIERVEGFLQQANTAIGALESQVDEAQASDARQVVAWAKVLDTVGYINSKDDVVGLATTAHELRQLKQKRQGQLSSAKQLAASVVVPPKPPLSWSDVDGAIHATNSPAPSAPVASIPDTLARLRNDTAAIADDTNAGLQRAVSAYFELHGDHARKLAPGEIESAVAAVVAYLHLLIGGGVVAPSDDPYVEQVVEELEISGIVASSPRGYRLMLG
ncbi:hypothetical protein DIURU_003041 [Diutina rugosa]|uniref:Uncharacterized protein n=1 Tax=Diutina rugosa TaxID=5481 RepID=A0A642UMX8_DIURU|nr:uncharacterized protein DIURU_003041 [Diutina rugosa]KAA8901990.1 hypothetical protein DIURU_003041 [Diutina rugosa]